jgi:hypothetical protein
MKMRAALTSVLLSVALIAAGCTKAAGGGQGERVVFTVATGFGQGLRESTTVDIDDIGVPDLYNGTGHAVKVLKVSLASAPRAARLLNVTAHPGQAVGIIGGNLLKLCKTMYPSYPVTDAVTAPHAYSNWHLVLAVTLTRPGRYDLRRVKIDYTTDGHNGWQYQNIFTTIFVRAARPGEKPEFDGCP